MVARAFTIYIERSCAEVPSVLSERESLSCRVSYQLLGEGGILIVFGGGGILIAFGGAGYLRGVS